MTVKAVEDQGQYIDVNGVRTHYHDTGTGPVVVLLHGSGPGVSAWANWAKNIGPLAERNRVIAVDMLGFGATERPASVRYSMRAWADHVGEFLRSMDIGRASIVGNSLGGRIALQVALDMPSQIDRLVLMGTPGVEMAPTEGLKALRAYEPSPAAMKELLVRYFAVDTSIVTDELAKIRYEASVAPGAHEAYCDMFRNPAHDGNSLSISVTDLRAISVPALVIHGLEDKVVPVSAGWELAQVLPNADFHAFARCGHWTQIERTAEFNELVRNFLR